jgi:Tol biopolymer transport system component
MALVAIVPVFGCGSGSPVPLAAPTPPTFGQPKNIGPTINSSDFDGGPSVSADELSLYFISDRPPSAGGDIWMATRASASEPFANPQRLGPEVNSPNSEGAPSILADGLELFFDRAPDGHIFVSTRASTSVSFRTAMALSLGNAVCCDGFPAISADGLELYFCSNRVGGSGGDDIWVAVRPTLSQPFGPPRNLGPTVNSGAGDCEPSISRDGLELFFASDRAGGSGSHDIWVTTRANRSEAFRKPTNLGPRFNTLFSDERPDISADGMTLYFMSNRPGGSGFFDLWEARRA